MEKPFPAYEGDDPYVFVSYSHEDETAVFKEIRWLQDRQVNIWYDEGISPGSEWSDALAKAIEGCTHFVYFLTPRSVASENCRRELNFAHEEHRQVLAVHLEETDVPSGIRLSLDNRQAVRCYELAVDTYRDKIRTTLAQAKPPAPLLPESPEPVSRRARPPKIAILPFACQVKNEDVVGWAEGLPDGIARSLSATTLERVLCRAQHLGLDAREVGRELDTQYILSGDVRVLAATVRVTVSLADARTGKQLWSNRNDYALESLLEEEDALLESLHRRIRESVRVHELRRIRHTPREALDAWALCALGAVVPTDGASAAESVALLKEARDADPDYGTVHGELAWLLTLLVVFGLSRDPESDKAEALACADRALELAPDDPQVLNNCSFAHRPLGSEVLALELAQRAATMTGMGWGRRDLHFALISNGRAADVVEEAQEHPASTTPLAMSCALVALGHYQEALEYAQKAAGLEPRNFYRWSQLANVLGHLGRDDEAREALAHARSLQLSPTLTGHEQHSRIMWRNNPEIVNNMVDGLRKLGLD